MDTMLRVLCGELEDMSVFNDAVSVMEVRARLEPAVAQSETRIRELEAALGELQSQLAAAKAREEEAAALLKSWVWLDSPPMPDTFKKTMTYLRSRAAEGAPGEEKEVRS